MKGIKLLAIFILTSAIIFGAEITGSVQSEYSGRTLNRNSTFNINNRLKLAEFKNLITGEILIKNEFSSSANCVLKIETKYSSNDFSEEFEVNKTYLKEGYIDILSDYFTIRAGKHFIKWGDGVFFNPSDVINITKNPLEDEKADEGSSVVQMSIPIESIAAVDILGLIKENRIKSPLEIPVVLRVSGNLDNVGGFAYVITEKDKKPVYGYDFNCVVPLSKICEMTIYSEGNYKNESRFEYVDEIGNVKTRNIGNIISASGGLKTVIRLPEMKKFDTVSLLVEYMNNNENWNMQEYKNYLKKSDTINRNLYCQFKGGQQYLYVNADVSNVIFSNMNMDMGNIINIEDKSGIGMVGVSYQQNENTTISFSGKIFYGGNESEFGNAILSNEFGINGKLNF